MQSAKKGGLVTQNPLETAQHVHEILKVTTYHLVQLRVVDRVASYPNKQLCAVVAAST